MFGNASPGRLVAITGGDERGSWVHQAFVPDPLPSNSPSLAGRTYRVVADARAALAALDSTARQLPEPTLFRHPALRREAQSTSALEGTYAPLARVLEADEDSPDSQDLREILNYVRMAEHGFAWVGEGRPLNSSLVLDLQRILMVGMPLAPSSGRVREVQVVIGQRPGADPLAPAVEGARFVPSPPGGQLEADLRAAVEWMSADHSGEIDPVVAAAMAHYQFETLHPFRDGNGRIGRYLIVLQLLHQGVLSEPTLTVSPWFEARRNAYYDRLLAVSTDGDWDGFVEFFATALHSAAELTRRQMLALSQVREDLRTMVRASKLRASTAVALIDVAVARPTFTVRQAHEALAVSYHRANALVGQLMQIGVLRVVDPDAYKRRFYAPAVLDVLLAGERS
jgi:Fic family protein